MPNSGNGEGTEHVYTESELNAMTKAQILELAESIGYTMTTTASNTKEEIIAEFLEIQNA